MKPIYTIIVPLIFISVQVSAQNTSVQKLIQETIDTCIDGSNGRELRDLARTWGMVEPFPDFFNSEQAVACYSDFLDVDVTFLPAKGTYVASSSVGKETALQKQLRLERDAKDKRQRQLEEQQERQIQLEAREAANTAKVNSKVYSACATLAKRDQIAAYTNQLCVSSFKVNGDPG